MFTKYPDFEVHGIGECENCHKEDVEICIIPDYMNLCKSCFEDETTLCSVCGQLWISDAIDFYEDEDGNPICEYCYEDTDEY
jgi:hypothetical protein